MKTFLKNTQKLILAQQGGIFSSAIILAFMIITSRLFGFLRYRVLAGYFTKEELDVFFASFRIPDLFFEILITGAFTSSFIPIFIKYQKNKNELEENVSTIFNILALGLVLLSLPTYFLLPQIITAITPGFDIEKINRIVFYSRLLLIGQLPFLVIGNFFTGIGQANRRFLITALAPIFYNLSIIIFTYLFATKFFLLAPVIGTMIGGILFLLTHLPLLSYIRFHYRFIIKINQAIKEFFRMIVPRIFTVIATQIDATIDLTLTTLLSAGSYTIFYLAQHLQLLPVSVIGIAFGQAALPYLSEIYQEKKFEEFKKVIIDIILNLFFLSFPVMSFFIFARTPLVRLFYGGQKFDWEATVKTAYTLSYFAISIPFHVIYYFITRCFYAILDSITPFLLSLFTIILNTILSLIFILILHLPVWSLAISFSLSIIINVVLMLFFLHLKLNELNLLFLFLETSKIFVITLTSSVISYFSMRLFDGLIFDTSRTINILLLLLTTGTIYLLLYLSLSWFFDIKQIFLISKLIIKTNEFKKKVLEIYSTYE